MDNVKTNHCMSRIWCMNLGYYSGTVLQYLPHVPVAWNVPNLLLSDTVLSADDWDGCLNSKIKMFGTMHESEETYEQRINDHDSLETSHE